MAVTETVLVVSLVASFILSVSYKFLVNQGEMKRIKGDMKAYKEKVDAAQKAGNTEEANKFLKEMMGASKKQFRMSMKPMVFSFILFLIVLFYLGNQFGINTVYFGRMGGVTMTPSELSSLGLELYDFTTIGGEVWQLAELHENVGFFEAVVRTPTLPFIGNRLHWFWYYVIITLVATLFFRKLLGVE